MRVRTDSVRCALRFLVDPWTKDKVAVSRSAVYKNSPLSSSCILKILRSALFVMKVDVHSFAFAGSMAAAMYEAFANPPSSSSGLQKAQTAKTPRREIQAVAVPSSPVCFSFFPFFASLLRLCFNPSSAFLCLFLSLFLYLFIYFFLSFFLPVRNNLPFSG